jgi:hypothetical protein
VMRCNGGTHPSLEASQNEVVAMLGKRAEVAATMAAVYKRSTFLKWCAPCYFY